MTGNENYVVINFEYYAYRARTLELPKAVYSCFFDDHREVFLQYDNEPEGRVTYPVVRAA